MDKRFRKNNPITENKHLGNFDDFISNNIGLANKVAYRYIDYLDKYFRYN